MELALHWMGKNIQFIHPVFHYRNHGADYGRVLVGLQVPQQDMKAFDQFLSTIGYPYWNESDNPVYKLFL